MGESVMGARQRALCCLMGIALALILAMSPQEAQGRGLSVPSMRSSSSSQQEQNLLKNLQSVNYTNAVRKQVGAGLRRIPPSISNPIQNKLRPQSGAKMKS